MSTSQCGVRERRIKLGLIQPELAAELGITFQHLYKFEKAKSRISAPRLYALSKALGVPVAAFFEGLAGTDTKAQKPSRRPKAARQNVMRLIALIIVLVAGALESGTMRAEDIQIKNWPEDVACDDVKKNPDGSYTQTKELMIGRGGPAP